jgi:4-hydroxy-3-methylbut-2-enyl diphosphate reductase
LTDFGAFIDLGGIDGLLPISEMSWTYIKHPSEVLRRNQRLKLTVLRVDREASRISLGLKQILEDPWQKVGEHFRGGDIVKGKVVRLVSSGAFVRLGDLDGFLPVAEAAEKRVNKIEDAFKVGDSVEAMVAEIRPDERRMLLSIRKMERERERNRVKEVLRQQEEESRVTIGDIAGALLQRAVATSTRNPAVTKTPGRDGEDEGASGS